MMFVRTARAAGLSFLPPYKNLDAADFEHGVNFAVAGSTALPSKVLAAQHIFSPVTTSSLNVQLDWMFNHFTSICRNSRDCVEKLQNALFMVGEIGGNDYNYAIFQGKTMEELRSMVPHVVATIVDAARSCKKPSTHSNKKPNAVIVYGDYDNAYKFLLQVATSHGLERERACCGTGGKYNFNMTRMCGGAGVEVCSDPERYMSWDGVHLTQQGYKIMAAWLVNNIFPHLLCHI
ncbi:UNVERIFIED_CONTAM: GDSL esterase/lipase [Sesamum latifolium]|uniref:GDSL esterase/lipase n=1 Tax=Sesamum latifolium TaxID=2727402 RepID=A0AAW2WQL9_9LAMI